MIPNERKMYMTYMEQRLNALYSIGPEKWAEENITSIKQAEELKARCEHGLESPFSKGKWDSEAIFSFTIEACECYLRRHANPA